MRGPDTVRVAAEAPFTPPLWLRNPHLQTMWDNATRRRVRWTALGAVCTAHDIPTSDGDVIRIHHSPSGDEPPRAIVVLLHGLTGCAEAANILSTAVKAHARGFAVVRVDLRNALTDSPSRYLGHAGRSEDLRSVLGHLLETTRGCPISVIGYSLGGNIALKAAGEWGRGAPDRLVAMVGISVPIHLDEAATSIDRRGNTVYRRYFLARLRHIYALRRERHPGLYPDMDLPALRTLRAWDGAVVAALCGFESAEDYYARSSALVCIGSVAIPTLLIQARDDPFIPFGAFEHPTLRNNAEVGLLAPRRGGHVGFIGSRRSTRSDIDCHWAENRAIEFCAARAGLDSAAR